MPVPLSAIPAAQRRLLGLLLALLLAAQIDQPYPEVALLQHIPTALLLALSPWLLRRWPMSTASVACIVLFLAFHTLGGRYASPQPGTPSASQTAGAPRRWARSSRQCPSSPLNPAQRSEISCMDSSRKWMPNASCSSK